ncbi:MAG: peptidoglycan-binding protein, partial [Microthrixaceae bacterium]
DVRELEETLVALGYDPDETVTVDEEYTAYTAAMVERWEEDMGVEVTGAVAGGAVVFLPGISRVGASAFDVGDTISSGDTVLSVTQSDRVLEFTVRASERDSLHIGDIVSARLPDRTTVDATVATIVFRSDGGIDVTAHPAGPVGFAVDTIPVTVSWQVPLGSNVLTVPADALIRTDGGTYNIEVRRPSGIEELVPVETGHSSGATVEVIGDITEGDEVVSPSHPESRGGQRTSSR